MDPVLSKVKDLFSKYITSGKLTLYGSRARGTHHDRSDYDIAYEIKSGAKNNFLAALIEPEFTLYKIDLLDYSSASKELKSAVDTEGKLICEK